MKHLRRYQVYSSDAAGTLHQFLGFFEGWDVTAEDALRAKLQDSDALQTLRKQRGARNLYKATFLGVAPMYYRAVLLR